MVLSSNFEGKCYNFIPKSFFPVYIISSVCVITSVFHAGLRFLHVEEMIQKVLDILPVKYLNGCSRIIIQQEVATLAVFYIPP